MLNLIAGARMVVDFCWLLSIPPIPGRGSAVKNEYNGIYALHNRGANSLFTSGSVKLIPIKEWARNRGGMWGGGEGCARPGGDPNYYK